MRNSPAPVPLLTCSLDIDTAVQLDQIFESPTGLSNRSCEHVVDCFHRCALFRGRGYA